MIKIQKENLCRFNVSITWQILLYDLLQISLFFIIAVGKWYGMEPKHMYFTIMMSFDTIFLTHNQITFV